MNTTLNTFTHSANPEFSEQKIGETTVLRKQNDDSRIILDPGLQHTAVCISHVGKINPLIPQISYRGYDVQTLAVENRFAEVAHLLIEGESKADGAFERLLIASTIERLPATRALWSSMPDSPLTSFESAAVLLAGADAKNTGREETSAYVIGAMAAATMVFHDPIGQHTNIIDSNRDDFVSLILAGCFGQQPKAAAYKALNEFLILHAEHGMNCSTLAVRTVVSTGGEAYDAIVAGIAAFKGPLHGGASRIVGEILDILAASGEDIERFIQRKLDSKERIHGFGHRIYRKEDPRAAFMRKNLECEQNHLSRYEKIALSLAQAAIRIEKFRERGIAVNPDLFNGLLLRRAGFVSSENTALLCLSRSAGWLAHHFDSINTKEPLLRPQELSA
ncbi:citrate/2-methylcitrate synthase [uncultured Cedecea sp.]|uniref:citrate/2-methylcitrate synthase n=1 Tax=uncultured Cedecea sp. TaxID=988762 RepID=UPI0026378635|nr:citrate/2-methylcitrate synthase [uncultured Cedecea sp.]